MEKSKEQQLGRLICLSDHFSEFKKAWEENSRFKENLDEMSNLITAIKGHNTSFMTTFPTSYTAAQYRHRDNAIVAVMRLTDPVTEWALSCTDDVLLASVKFERTDLIKQRRATGIERLRQLCSICEREAPGIPGCLLSEADFAEARACVERYASARSTRQKKQASRTNDRLSIEGYLKQGTLLLKKLDLLMRAYAGSHPEFFQKYRMLRVLPKQGKKKSRNKQMPFGTVHDVNELKPTPGGKAAGGETDITGTSAASAEKPRETTFVISPVEGLKPGGTAGGAAATDKEVA